MFLLWIKRLGALSLVLLMISEAMAQYGSMPYYGADAGLTYGTPVGPWTGGQMGYGQRHAEHLQRSVPRSPGAGISLVNGGARFWGVGYSEGYHACSSCAGGACGRYGACNPNFGSVLSGGLNRGQMRGPSPNIVAPGAAACQSCPTPVHNTPCGNKHFGSYNLHPGHVFGKPSYGNPLFAPDCINWRQAVKYDSGPCIPSSVYTNHLLTPTTVYSGNHEGVRNGSVPHVPLPHAPVLSNSSPLLPQSVGVSHNPPRPSVPQPRSDSSPSDLNPSSWPWQREQGSSQQVPSPHPKNLTEPTPAQPTPAQPTPAQPIPAQTTPAQTIPQVPAPPVPPAPKTESAPVVDDEDLLSNRRNPIRQPARR